MDCIFCKIVNGEIPAEKIYEDENFLCMLDINPDNPGHALILPKAHFPTLLETPDGVLSQITVLAKKIAPAIGKALGYSAFNFIVNNGSIAGQMVPHLHMHIIPRKEGDGHRHFESGKYREGEMAEAGEKIREAL